MSKVLDAVTTPTDASTATPDSAAPAPAPAPASEPTIAEQQRSWSRDEKQHWRMTGEFPKTPDAAKAPAAKTETTDEPSVPHGKTEAVSETAEDDQELPEGDTAEARRARNQMFAKMRREKAALKAERDLLQSQRQERQARQPDSAPAPKAEPKADAKPDKFTFREPTDSETWGDYQQARDEAHAEFILERAERRVFGKMDQRKADETAKQREDRVTSEHRARQKTVLSKREGEDADAHRTRTLEYANASRWLTGLTERAQADHIEQAILESEFGPQLIQHFGGKAQAEFEAILQMTPHRALLAIGKAEARFESGKTPELKPVTRSSTPDPGPRVNSQATAKADPIKEAEDNHTRTGDPKYLRELNRLRNARDIAARSR